MTSTGNKSSAKLIPATTKDDPGNTNDEDDDNGSIDEDNMSECDTIPVPTKKRARINQAESKARHKRHVRGKQGGLKGLMNMPIEIFTEIAHLLTPGDLIALARSSKFFRKLLLQRSAIEMWRRAENNVSGLPPCPPDMCEPQYAALVFSKHCTLCGASATAKPDVDLCVRLCASCRDTELEELNRQKNYPPPDLIGLVHTSKDIRPKRNKSRPRALKGSVFCLRREAMGAIDERARFHRAGGNQGLAKWERSRQAIVAARRQHADRLFSYLENIEASHEEELETIKTNRRATIVERLKELGWTDEDMTFCHGRRFHPPEEKSWHALVDAPKPLTDRIWSNLLPKLTQMLEENRERNIARGIKERRIERRARVDQFLMNMRYNDHPFAPILDALGVGVPPPPDLSEVRHPGLSTQERAFLLRMRSHLEIANPFPETCTALEWDCLEDLSEVEMSIEEVGAKLEDRKARIGEKILEWRATTEERLLERFGSSTYSGDDDVVLTVKGSTDSTAHLARSSRLLLRADTLFKRSEPGSRRALSVSSGEKPPCYYPDFVSARCKPINEDIDPLYVDPEPDQETDLDHFVRDVETEEIVKPLLRDLGMPDVAHIELQVMKNRFVCGRCTDTRPKRWADMVVHYIKALEFWNTNNGKESVHHTRHQVVFRNVHDLKPMDNSEPLVRLLQGEIPKSNSHSKISPDDTDQPHCYLCEGTGRQILRLPRGDMLAHMQDLHDTAEPVEGIYYGKELHGDLSDKWHKEWDAFHDTHEDVTAYIEEQD